MLAGTVSNTLSVLKQRMRRSEQRAMSIVKKKENTDGDNDGNGDGVVDGDGD